MSGQPLPPEQLAGWVRNRVPSRERAESLRRIALYLRADSQAAQSMGLKGAEHNDEDAEFLNELADFLLDLRVNAKGGRRNVYGSRHWNDGNNPHGED